MFGVAHENKSIGMMSRDATMVSHRLMGMVPSLDEITFALKRKTRPRGLMPTENLWGDSIYIIARQEPTCKV